MGTPAEPALERLAVQVAEDRRALLAVMRGLRVQVRCYKSAMADVGEARSDQGQRPAGLPFTADNLVELEGLRLGVQGKEAG